MLYPYPGTLADTLALWPTPWHSDEHPGTLANTLALWPIPWHSGQHPGTLAHTLLKQVDPRFLADAENLFIVQFKADTKHLNRYKALRFD